MVSSVGHDLQKGKTQPMCLLTWAPWISGLLVCCGVDDHKLQKVLIGESILRWSRIILTVLSGDRKVVVK